MSQEISQQIQLAERLAERMKADGLLQEEESVANLLDSLTAAGIDLQEGGELALSAMAHLVISEEKGLSEEEAMQLALEAQQAARDQR